MFLKKERKKKYENVRKARFCDGFSLIYFFHLIT